MKTLTPSFQKKEGEDLPIKILQIGEGNFMRGFFDWLIQQLNNQGFFQGNVAAVQPTPHGKKLPTLRAQGHAYTVILRGSQNGETINESEIITAIAESVNPYNEWEELKNYALNPDIQIVTSNTTEAGLKDEQEAWTRDYALSSFPGKVVQLLYERFCHFEGDDSKGWYFIPCELVENNGDVLKEIVLKKCREWELGEDFIRWVNEANHFCRTLVDRIVTGYPRNEEEELQQQFGYEDQLMTVVEPYYLFVIDGPPEIKQLLPFDQLNTNVKFDRVDKYAELKIRLLNAPHTMLFALGTFCGEKTVYNAMQNQKLNAFVRKTMHTSIIPLLTQPKTEAEEFAEAVLQRFNNPYQQHYLSDLGQNGIAKFASRVLPLWLKCPTNGQGQHYFAIALAALLAYYRPNAYGHGQTQSTINGELYPLREKEETINKLYEEWEGLRVGTRSFEDIVHTCLVDFFDLKDKKSEALLPEALIAHYLKVIIEHGGEAVIDELTINLLEEK